MSNGSSATRSRERVRLKVKSVPVVVFEYCVDRPGRNWWTGLMTHWLRFLVAGPGHVLKVGIVFLSVKFLQANTYRTWHSTLSVMLGENVLVLPIRMGLHWVGHVTTTTDAVGGCGGYFTDFLSVISFCPNLYCFYFTTLYSSLSSAIKDIVIFAVLIPFCSILMIATRFLWLLLEFKTLDSLYRWGYNGNTPRLYYNTHTMWWHKPSEGARLSADLF